MEKSLKLEQALTELQNAILREGGDGDLWIEVSNHTFELICQEMQVYTKYSSQIADGIQTVTRTHLFINTSLGKVTVVDRGA